GINAHAFDAGPGLCGQSAQPREGPVVGVVARLDLQKGFEYLLRALGTLRHSFPSLRLLIAGEGPDRARIEELVSQQRLHGCVTIAGQQTDVSRVYASIDIFVLPSLNEGLPMTLLEAMAASKPIIATRVGAVPTIITDGETGLLIDPANETSLTKALLRLLADPGLCRHLAHRAREHVERHYTAAVMIQKYGGMYRAVLTRRGCHEATQVPARMGADGSSRQRAESASGSGTSESMRFANRYATEDDR